jgi:RsiW-degrading membrane proteinase PrsW (M82 family)
LTFLREILLLLAAISYSIVLSFSIIDQRPQKRRSILVLLGFLFGFVMVATLVGAVVVATRYDLLPQPLFVLILAPIVEETMKYLTVFALASQFQGTGSRSEMIRIGGAVGLGFGVNETLGFILNGTNLATTVLRLFTAVPFHMVSGLILATAFTERKYLLLLVAMALHSFTNYLAGLNSYLQAGVVFFAFIITYFPSTEDYNLYRNFAQKLRRFMKTHNSSGGA